MLIQRGDFQSDDALVGPRDRLSNFEHFGLDAQRVPRSHRPKPLKVVQSGSDQPTGDAHVTQHDQLDGQSGCMPTTRHESAEETARRCRLVQVLGLRIELLSEGFDLAAVDRHGIRLESLAHREIFQVVVVRHLVQSFCGIRRADLQRALSVFPHLRDCRIQGPQFARHATIAKAEHVSHSESGGATEQSD
jgi:hypothetical protein